MFKLCRYNKNWDMLDFNWCTIGEDGYMIACGTTRAGTIMATRRAISIRRNRKREYTFIKKYEN